MKEHLEPIRLLREHWTVCYSYFSNQTNTMTTYFQDHVYFAESHIPNRLVGRGKQLKANLVYAPSGFDRKTTSICFKIISICWKLFLKGSPPW